MTLLPSSQIAVKVADTSPRKKETVVSVTCVPLLSLRRPCCLFPAHVADLVKSGDLNLSGILDAVVKSTLRSPKDRLFNRRTSKFECLRRATEFLTQDRAESTRLASSLAFQHSRGCSLPHRRRNSLQRRLIAHQNELQQQKDVPIRIHPSPSDPLSSFGTRQAVRRCALQSPDCHRNLELVRFLFMRHLCKMQCGMW